jgi:hypothetical protein
VPTKIKVRDGKDVGDTDLIPVIDAEADAEADAV